MLHTLQDAVLAVDSDNRVIAANPRMQRILGTPADALMGQDLGSLQAELSLRETLTRGVEERGGVLRYQGRDWIAHRSPISERGAVVGAALTLYDARQIQEEAVRQGMIEFHRNAMLKVAQGVTSTEEVLRVLPPEQLGLEL